MEITFEDFFYKLKYLDQIFIKLKKNYYFFKIFN